MHAKSILSTALNDMDALLSMYCSKEVLTMDLLMTRHEAAAFIGRTVTSLDRMCREGKLTKTYLQGQPRIRKSELLKFKGVVFVEFREAGETDLDSILKRYRPEIIH